MSGNTPSYYAAVDQIIHVEWTIPKLQRLALVQRALAALWPEGHPTRFIQVAGTSGKSSTAQLLRGGLAGAGHLTGAFVSPHVFDLRERVTVGSDPVAPGTLVTAWEERILPYCLDASVDLGAIHTFSEAMLLLALELFATAGVEWAAIETGVGGRYDQTTALPVAATVITNVGDDHRALLGDELWQRALDKAGVIRRRVPVTTAEPNEATRQLLADTAADRNAPFAAVTDSEVTAVSAELAALGHLDPGALLLHPIQHRNAAVALKAIEGLGTKIDRAAVLRSMATVSLPARFSQVDEGVYADIAHNPSEIAAVAVAARERFPDRPVVYVAGVSGTRAPGVMLGELFDTSAAVVVTSSVYRGQPAGQVAGALTAAHPEAAIHVVADPRDAVDKARELAGRDGVVIVTGSTFVVDEALNADSFLRHLNTTMGWRYLAPGHEPGRIPGH